MRSTGRCWCWKHRYRSCIGHEAKEGSPPARLLDMTCSVDFPNQKTRRRLWRPAKTHLQKPRGQTSPQSQYREIAEIERHQSRAHGVTGPRGGTSQAAHFVSMSCKALRPWYLRGFDTRFDRFGISWGKSCDTRFLLMICLTSCRTTDIGLPKWRVSAPSCSWHHLQQICATVVESCRTLCALLPKKLKSRRKLPGLNQALLVAFAALVAQSFLIIDPSAKSHLIGSGGRVPCLLQAAIRPSSFMTKTHDLPNADLHASKSHRDSSPVNSSCTWQYHGQIVT